MEYNMTATLPVNEKALFLKKLKKFFRGNTRHIISLQWVWKNLLQPAR